MRLLTHKSTMVVVYYSVYFFHSLEKEGQRGKLSQQKKKRALCSVEYSSPSGAIFPLPITCYNSGSTQEGHRSYQRVAWSLVKIVHFQVCINILAFIDKMSFYRLE